MAILLGTLRAPSDAVIAAIARGDVEDGAASEKMVMADTLRAVRTIMPSMADFEVIRTTYVVGGANPARASSADQFFLAISRVGTSQSRPPRHRHQTLLNPSFVVSNGIR